MKPLSREAVAERLARDLPQGAVVNLGIGMPGVVAKCAAAEQDVILQSENGVLHFEALAAGVDPDMDSIDASKKPITVLPGGAYVDVMTSFGLMRGGHLDIAVLGAFEVSAAGDLANWWTGQADDVPGIGGAMDLACGAKSIWAIMEHTSKDGRPKIVERCAYPLTAPRVISRIFTDLAVLDITPSGVRVIEKLDGLSNEELQSRTGTKLLFG